MHDLGPPRNERLFPQTPGMPDTDSGSFSHRSGLNRQCENQDNCVGDLSYILELKRILAPKSLVSIQGEYGNKYGILVGNSGISRVALVKELTRRRTTCLIVVWTWPFRSVNGISSGMKSSLVATRTVMGTGACKRSVSRATASRYGSAINSSIVGEDVSTVNSSSRSFFCTCGAWVRAYKHHVVAELVVSCPATRKLCEKHVNALLRWRLGVLT